MDQKLALSRLTIDLSQEKHRNLKAQAAFLVNNNDAFAVASQDADAFLFGATRVVRNLAITGKRKMPGKFSYDKVNPEIVELKDVLNSLGIDQDQLIVLSMLVGTDYNIGGIKGIGPKKALGLVKTHGKDFDKLFEEYNKVRLHRNCIKCRKIKISKKQRSIIRPLFNPSKKIILYI